MEEKVTLTQRLLDYFIFGIWRIRIQDLPRKKSFFIKLLRIFILTIRKFDSDHCSLRASALTFYALLSIVPVVAMAFGVAKGFGYEGMLQAQLASRFAGQEEVFARVVVFAKTLLENTRGGMVAGVGIIILLWTVVKVLYHIEQSFNEIWEVDRDRPIRRKFANYIAIMVIGPLLLILSGSLTVFVHTQVVLVTEKIAFLGMLSPFIFGMFKLIPYILIWAVLTFIYTLMPNTKVVFRSALISAVIAGTAYQFAQWGYIHFQVGIARYNAIYGSFAALPLFLIWLEISWIIVLFGAEISYAHQNVDKYEFEHECKRASPYFKKLLALYITHLLIENFSKGSGLITVTTISDKLSIPYPLVQNTLTELEECGIILDIKPEDADEQGYQIAMDINQLSLNYVLNALDKKGINELPINDSREFGELKLALSRFKDILDATEANKLIKDI